MTFLQFYFGFVGVISAVLFTIWSKKTWMNAFIKFLFLAILIASIVLGLGVVSPDARIFG